MSPPTASVAGKAISAIVLPKECLIGSLRREHKIHVVRGNTGLQGKDKLTVFSHHECSEEVHRILSCEDVDSGKEKSYHNYKIPGACYSIVTLGTGHFFVL